MKILLIFTLAFIAAGSSLFSQTPYAGTFGFGVELSATGAGATNTGLTLYALDQGGGNRLLPTASAATISNSWTGTSNPVTPTFNLGTFDPTVGDLLVITGGSLLTYQGSGGVVDPTAQYLNYQVYPSSGSQGSFTGFNLPLDSSNPSGSNNGDMRFATESQNINLLNGLSAGVYVLDIYGYSGVATPSGSANYESNSGTNFAAQFKVVPEPGTGQ